MKFAHDILGMRLFPWQRWLLIHGMELLPNGRFRFRTLLVLVARQNGKTTLVEVKNLWKMFVLRVPLIIGTAQNLDISEESLEHGIEIVEGIPELAAEVRQKVQQSGRKSLKISDDQARTSRWKVVSASRRGGRSLSGDDVNLDELREHLTWDAWSAVSKTTQAKAKAQTWAYSNQGDDRSVVLHHLTDRGLKLGENATGRFGLFDWSAPYDFVTQDYCPMDWRPGWAMANPSLNYPGGVLEEAIEDSLATDPEAAFRTEVLCQRVAGIVLERWLVIGQNDWNALIHADARAGEPIALAADATHDQRAASISIAGLDKNELMVGELVDAREGTAWLPGRIRELKERWNPCAVVIDPKRQASPYIPDLEAAEIEVTKPTARDMAQACGAIYAYVTDSKRFRHRGQAEPAYALSRATRRNLEGAWAWDAPPEVDITSIVSMTLAVWGHATKAHLMEESQPFFGSWR